MLHHGQTGPVVLQGRRMRCKETATSSHLHKWSYSTPISSCLLFLHPLSTMLSIFAFILLLNAVFASPSVRLSQVTESSVSLSNNGRINATGAIDANEAPGNINARQVPQPPNTFSMPFSCDPFACSVTVSIGTQPAVEYTLLLDTSASITWVGNNKPFVSTSSTISTDGKFELDYIGVGQFFGSQVLDSITLAPGIVVSGQSIGVANQTSGGFHGLDGVLGLGRSGQSKSVLRVAGSPNQPVSTVLDNLKNQGTISSRTFNIISQPIGQSDTTPGVITFGGTESSGLITSNIELFPTTESTIGGALGGADASWALDIDVKYGTTDLMSKSPAFFSVASTGVVMASDVFENYQKATGGSFDAETNQLVVTLDQAGALQPLNFTFLGNLYSLSANAQIMPRKPGDDFDTVTLMPRRTTASSTEDFGIFLGTTFMEYFYTAYDDDEGFIGLATTPFTNSAVN